MLCGTRGRRPVGSPSYPERLATLRGDADATFSAPHQDPELAQRADVWRHSATMMARTSGNSQSPYVRIHVARVTSAAPGVHGHGVITPVQSWRKDGRDCYHGRYQFTFHDGTTESGDIVWPFCYDRSVDPFTHPAQPMPFPLPLVGFKLPDDTQMPPIEKRVYEKWAAANAPASSPP